MDDLLKEAKAIIFSMGGCEADYEQISEEIEINGYTSIEEVKKHLDNYYSET